MLFYILICAEYIDMKVFMLKKKLNCSPVNSKHTYGCDDPSHLCLFLVLSYFSKISKTIFSFATCLHADISWTCFTFPECFTAWIFMELTNFLVTIYVVPEAVLVMFVFKLHDNLSDFFFIVLMMPFLYMD